MSAQHTPGPWVVVAGNQRRAVRVCAKSETISVATVHSLTDQDANARLIAAAPETAAERDQLRALNADMLAALRALVARDADISDLALELATQHKGFVMEPEEARALIAARAAIARAEGREP
jgi:hypothetical protein